MERDDDVHIEAAGDEEFGGSESELEEEEARADGKVKKLKAEIESLRKEKQEYLVP
jgi:hypothetical protein